MNTCTWSYHGAPHAPGLDWPWQQDDAHFMQWSLAPPNSEHLDEHEDEHEHQEKDEDEDEVEEVHG